MIKPTILKVATRSRKWGVALIGVLAQVVALGILPDKYQQIGAALVALAVALGVYAVPNRPQPARAAEPTAP
jgi:hypothetical protein